MKKALLLFLFLPLFSFGQQTEAPANKNEFGLNLFSLKRFQVYGDYENGRSIYTEPHLVPGIYYKRHFGKNAFRSAFEFTRREKEAIGKSGPLYVPYSIVTVVSINVGISVGYERSFGNKKLQPFAFTDLVFNYENTEGEIQFSNYGGGGLYPFLYEDFEYSLSVGGGLRYKLNSQIHFCYEISAQGYRDVFQDILHAGNKIRGEGYHINPVNKLGVAILF